MPLIQTIIDFMSRSEYDFERSDIQQSNFHPQMYLVIAYLGIFYGQRDSYLRLIVPVIGAGFSILGIAILCLNIYMRLLTSDYSGATESFCYWLMLMSIITVYSGFLPHKKEILNQFEEMEADFKYICSLGPTYRKPFLDGQLLIWQLFYLWNGMLVGIGVLFLMFPTMTLMYQSLFITLDEHITRPLIYPLCLPNIDVNKSPNYEIFFFIEFICTIIFVTTFGGYVYVFFHILLHYYTLLNMIILDFEVYFDGLDPSVAYLSKKDPRRIAVQMVLNKRLGRIVTWHISVHRALKTVTIVCRFPLVYQMTVTAGALCFMTYQIAEDLDKGSINILFTLLAGGTVIQLWIPCYLGTILRNKGFDVGDACWGCGWQNTPLGRMVRVELVTFILRTQMPMFIKFTSQPVIQLETFSATITRLLSHLMHPKM